MDALAECKTTNRRSPVHAVRMKRPVSRALCLAIALAAAGCATMGAEQAARRDLLSQAAQECQQRYPFVSHFQFDRFDRLQWFYREGTPSTERELFITCYRDRVAELTKTEAASTPAGRPAQVDTPAPSDAWKEPPTWKVGDEWHYRWESPRGGGTFVWRVASEEVVEGVECYVIEAGRLHLYYRKADLAFVQEKDRGLTQVRNTPPRQFLTWPLYVGRTWEQLYVEERPYERVTSNRLRVWRVEARERISVPAGTFETFKLVERDKWSNTVVFEIWTAPDVKGIVRSHGHFDYGVQQRQLTSFKLN